MFGFGGKNKFIGVDIGTSTIKMVEIKVSGNKPVLLNYAWAKVEALAEDKEIKNVHFEMLLPEYLKRMLKAGKFESKNAYLSIPAFGALLTLIEFPEMVREDLDQAIKFEAHKYIPTSLDDVVLSWDVVGKKGSPRLITQKTEGIANVSSGGATSGKIQVLLVAAPKNRVIKYEKLAHDLNLEIKTIEIESFSLVRSLIGNDQGNFMIIDIGSRVCNIILVEKGVIKVNRNIDAGGRDITKAISKSMNIEEERAERLKISGKNFLDKESHINFPVLELIAGEVSRVINAYYKNEEASIDGIILTGGTAGLAGIEEYFFKALNIKTTVGNPFGRIEYDKKLEPKIRDIKTMFSVCVGLALKGFEDYLRKK